MHPRPSPALALRGPGRCQLAFTAPFALLGGALFGHQVAPDVGVPWPVGAVVSSAALLAFVAFQIALEPRVVDRFGGADGRWGALVAYAWDALTGTVLGLPVVAALGAGALPGVGAAVTAGAAYGYVMGFVLCGDGPEALVRLVFEGGGGRRRQGYSYAQTLLARGRPQEALAVLERALAEDPAEPEPWFAVAGIQARTLGDRDAAVATLRRALRTARLTDGHVIAAFQRMAALFAAQDRPEALAPDLARYLEAARPGVAADWARDALAGIKRRMGEPDSHPR